MAKAETAEQKLLKMIEASASGTGAPKTAVKFIQKKNLLEGVRTLNNILNVGLIAAVGFLLVEIFQGWQLTHKNLEISKTSGLAQQSFETKNAVPLVQNINYYLAGVKRRNLLAPYDGSASKQIASTSVQNKNISKMTQNLKLVGISWLDTIDSASVMLEDTEKSITHYLQRGDKVGDITVKNIYADSVELGYENEEILIRYDKTQM